MTDGDVSAQLEYSPFGEVLVAKGYLPRYQFSTKEHDSETGLNYYGYRFYNPLLGRWMSRDPIDELGHQQIKGYLFSYKIMALINSYLFLYNQPLIYIDAHGEHPVVVGAVCVVSAYLIYKALRAVYDALEEMSRASDEDTGKIKEAQEKFMDDPTVENLNAISDAVDKSVASAREALVAGANMPGTGMQGPFPTPLESLADAITEIALEAMSPCDECEDK